MTRDLEILLAIEEKFKQTLDELHEAYLDAVIPHELKAEGWVYRRFPWVATEYFVQLTTIIGEENLVMLSGITKNDAITGSFMISPDGLENILKFKDQRDGIINV